MDDQPSVRERGGAHRIRGIARTAACPTASRLSTHTLSSVSASVCQNHALAIMSYNGDIDFGLIADYDTMAGVDFIADGIGTEIAALLDASKAAPAGRQPESAPEPAAQSAP